MILAAYQGAHDIYGNPRGMTICARLTMVLLEKPRAVICCPNGRQLRDELGPCGLLVRYHDCRHVPAGVLEGRTSLHQGSIESACAARSAWRVSQPYLHLRRGTSRRQLVRLGGQLLCHYRCEQRESAVPEFSRSPRMCARPAKPPFCLINKNCASSVLADLPRTR